MGAGFYPNGDRPTYPVVAKRHRRWSYYGSTVTRSAAKRPKSRLWPSLAKSASETSTLPHRAGSLPRQTNSASLIFGWLAGISESQIYPSIRRRRKHATHGTLRIDGKDLETKPLPKDAAEVSFETELKKGSYKLGPVFKLTDGEVGAYYTVVTWIE